MPALPIATFGNVQVIPYASAVVIDAFQGSHATITLTGTVASLGFTNPANGQILTLEVVQDSTGSRTVTEWTNVMWAGGTAPTLTTTAGATDVLRFTYNASRGKWLGETVGKAFA